jgi:hypothetical protein
VEVEQRSIAAGTAAAAAMGSSTAVELEA